MWQEKKSIKKSVNQQEDSDAMQHEEFANSATTSVVDEDTMQHDDDDSSSDDSVDNVPMKHNKTSAIGTDMTTIEDEDTQDDDEDEDLEPDGDEDDESSDEELDEEEEQQTVQKVFMIGRLDKRCTMYHKRSNYGKSVTCYLQGHSTSLSTMLAVLTINYCWISTLSIESATLVARVLGNVFQQRKNFTPKLLFLMYHLQFNPQLLQTNAELKQIVDKIPPFLETDTELAIQEIYNNIIMKPMLAYELQLHVLNSNTNDIVPQQVEYLVMTLDHITYAWLMIAKGTGNYEQALQEAFSSNSKASVFARFVLLKRYYNNGLMMTVEHECHVLLNEQRLIDRRKMHVLDAAKKFIVSKYKKYAQLQISLKTIIT